MPIPKKETLARELETIENARIALLVITGAWSFAFEASSDAIAAAAVGRRPVIQAGHHFPQIVPDELNQGFAEFVQEREATG